MRIKYSQKSFPTLIILFLQLTACNGQASIQNKTNTFSEIFNAEVNNENLLLGCFLYDRELKFGKLDSKDHFIEVAAEFQKSLILSSNVDSLIDDFIDKKKLDFSNRKSIQKVKYFIENYRLVNELILAELESDDNPEVLNSIELNLLRHPLTAKIYRTYISKDQDFNSLAPSEGLALTIHLAYMLEHQVKHERSKIIKTVL
jgi:hypothetical protein